MRSHIIILAAGLLIAQSLSADETLIMTAPPRESVEKGQDQYQVTAEYISEVLGKPVRYEHPGDWLSYQNDMRNGKYDIVFDGPHFASWRVAHLDNEMLVRLPGTLQFYLVTSADRKDINGPDDMIGKKFCGISPPNLSSLSILGHFRNPVRQPVIKGIRGGMGAVYKAFKKGDCDAMVLRTSFYKNKLKDEDRKDLKIIFTSAAMPNQSISSSPKLNPDERQKLRAALLNPEGTKALQPTLNRFARRAKGFIETGNEEFRGYNNLLEGVIFGW
ncbi:MAG: PhnD/SsuA/transferrin family substrate-binding protein [Thiohalophilus sp.]|jgi:ABC-type phosphate/phosphonate transport system substrate-binding protein